LVAAALIAACGAARISAARCAATRIAAASAARVSVVRRRVVRRARSVAVRVRCGAVHGHRHVDAARRARSVRAAVAGAVVADVAPASRHEDERQHERENGSHGT
jgi:hypothetical protein